MNSRLFAQLDNFAVLIKEEANVDKEGFKTF